MKTPLFEVSTEGLTFRKNLNFDQVRSAVGTAAIMLMRPRFADVFQYQSDMITEAARYGLLIDAGHLPDKVIRTIGKRGAELTFQRAFDHPFGDRPWLLTHTWESDEVTELDDSWFKPEDAARIAEARAVYRKDGLISTHLYLVEPTSNKARFGAVVTEYAFVSVKNGPPKVKFFLSPFARVILDHTDQNRFQAVIEGEEYTFNPGTAGSALNPMMTALMLLNTRGVATETVAPPKIVNAARIKKGKGPIPGYTRALSSEYVTAILSAGRTHRAAHGESVDKRRSPIPHMRRGHIRTYASGGQTWIRDMLVGVKSEGELAFTERHRVGYKIRSEDNG